MLTTSFPQGARFSQKRYDQNLRSWIAQINEGHIGHFIYYRGGPNGEEVKGEVMGASPYAVDEDYTTAIIRVRVIDSPFPYKVFLDQVIRCSCQEGKT